MIINPGFDPIKIFYKFDLLKVLNFFDQQPFDQASFIRVFSFKLFTFHKILSLK